jgi:hypothetical protein
MKRTLMIALIVLLLAQMFSLAALAAPGDPVGGCPPPFELHHLMHDDPDPMHVHLHFDADQNGDGWVCMMHLPKDLHLHTDNNFPF